MQGWLAWIHSKYPHFHSLAQDKQKAVFPVDSGLGFTTFLNRLLHVAATNLFYIDIWVEAYLPLM